MTKFRPDTEYWNVIENPSTEDIAGAIKEKWPRITTPDTLARLIEEEAANRKARITRTYTIKSYVAVEHAPSLTPRHVTVLAYVKATFIDLRTPANLNFDADNPGPLYTRIPLLDYIERSHPKVLDNLTSRCNTCYLSIPTGSTFCDGCDPDN